MSISFQLIHFEKVLVSGPYQLFDDDFKLLLKQNDAFYNPEFKGWVLPLFSYGSILEKIRTFFPSLNTQIIPPYCFKILQKFTKLECYLNVKFNYSNENKSLRNLNNQLFLNLYDYQRDGIQLGIKLNGRILLADEMGVGKTIQSLALASLYEEFWPLLVLCPSSLRLNWQDEIMTWLKIDKTQIQIIQNSKDAIRLNIKILIMSYDIATKFSKELEKFKIAIADEVHYLKNMKANRTQACLPILRKCRYIFLLTGTPALSKPRELFNIVHIIRPDIFSNFKEYGFRYCDPKLSRFTQGYDYNGASNIQELHFLLKNFIMIRRLKQDVLQQLPEKRRIKIKLAVDEKLKRQIQALLSKIDPSKIQDLIEDKGGNDEEGLGAITKCYVLSGQAKIDSIKQYMETLLENEIKFLFFAHHTEILDEAEKVCKQQKVGYMRIDGSTSYEKRHDNVFAFQNNNEIRVAILSITVAATGLTLTAASTIVFAEMHWTPAIMVQAEDRAHRIGQRNNVDCHYLIGNETLDDLLYFKLEKKMKTISNIVDGVSKQFDAIELNQVDALRLAHNQSPQQLIENPVTPQQNSLQKSTNQSISHQKSQKITSKMKTLEELFEIEYQQQQKKNKIEIKNDSEEFYKEKEIEKKKEKQNENENENENDKNLEDIFEEYGQYLKEQKEKDDSCKQSIQKTEVIEEEEEDSLNLYEELQEILEAKKKQNQTKKITDFEFRTPQQKPKIRMLEEENNEQNLNKSKLNQSEKQPIKPSQEAQVQDRKAKIRQKIRILDDNE